MIGKDFAIGILLFLSQSSFVLCKNWEPSNSKMETVCQSVACSTRGKLYFDNLNPAVHPCNDFYSFVCGSWFAVNKSPEHLASWTIHNVIEKRLLHDLREIIEMPAGNRPDPELMRVKYFYDICMKQPSYGRKSPKDIAGRINKIGRFGKKSLWDIHEGYLQLTGESAFFHHNTYALRPKELIPLLIVREVISPYGAILHNAWKHEEAENYKQFLYVLMKSLKLSGTDAALKAKINAVFKFRHLLNEIVFRSRTKGETTNKLMSAREFEQWYKGFGAGRVKQSGMPWEKILKTLLSVMPKSQKQDMQITTVYEEKYFKDLETLLSSTSEEILVNHMEMYFAERHTVFTGTMEDLLERTSIEPTDLAQSIREDVPKWETCLKYHNMWGPIGKILQQKWFNKDITPPMTELVGHLKDVIKSQVNNSTWLDGKAKTATTNRLNQIKSWIGFPSWYDDPSNDIHSEIALNNPMQPDAYLHLDNLIMFVKSTLLLPPFFDPDLPNVYNYGGVGFVVGHELYHFIDECGKISSSGNSAPLWSTGIRDQCKARKKCFINAYAEETQAEFLSKYRDSVQANKKSYSEDIPDVMGLEAAFRLYQAMLKKDESICRTLPHFEKYSCEQMFFIAFANTMCGKVPAKNAAKYQIQNDRHSLHSVRVNGAVQNSPFFETAFQCSEGKPMNRPVKCNIWK